LQYNRITVNYLLFTILLFTKTAPNSKDNKTCRLRTKSPVKIFTNNKKILQKQLGENFIEFEAKTGEIYRMEEKNEKDKFKFRIVY
jgi:hypothetical protein